MERIIVQIEQAALAELDAVATDEASSRAALVREAIARFLAERRRSRELQAAVLAYREEPPDDLVADRDHLQRGWSD